MAVREFGTGAGVALAAEVMLWWIALTLAWVTTISTLAPADLLIGAACGLVCAVVASAIRRALRQSWRPDVRWLAWLGPLAVAVPVDTVRLLVRAVPRLLADREHDGELRRLRPATGEVPARAAFRRAWAAIAVSATPSSVVVDWPPDGAPVVVHAVGPGRRSLDKAVVG